MSKSPPFRVKYCDYDESKHLEDTAVRTVRGTYRFMAPEIASNYLSNTEDVWSLGIVLYLLAEKSYPFDGLWITNDDVIPRRNSEFGDLIEKMLVKDASRRITVKQLANQFKIRELSTYIGSFDENLVSKYQIWTMEKEMLSQLHLIACLESTITTQEAKIQTLESKLPYTCRQLAKVSHSSKHSLFETGGIVVDELDAQEIQHRLHQDLHLSVPRNTFVSDGHCSDLRSAELSQFGDHKQHRSGYPDLLQVPKLKSSTKVDHQQAIREQVQRFFEDTGRTVHPSLILINLFSS
ncbi:hypothetical protein RCL1_007535 [Eukaryota sp. TZLM3-RCL]